MDVADKSDGMLQAWGVSEKGPRPTNQDRFAIDEDLRLCVIADGMGGHNAGEVAARLAVDAVLDVMRGRQRLPPANAVAAVAAPLGGWPFGFDPSFSEAGNLIRTAIYRASVQVLEEARQSIACAGMGTTIVAAFVVNGRLSVGHAGDSRLYRLGGGRLRQLTGDDSWMATVLAKDPQADASLLQDHPFRHVLTNVVGCRRPTDVHVVEEPLARGDRLLLTTDGVHDVLDDRSLEGLLADSDEPAGAASDIVRAAIAGGSHDNCTAVVAQYFSD
jgi:serine/threonine protein phosphatase PrpC